MHEATCHCGNISIIISNLPTSVTSCNCSLCNRLGTLWGYYSPKEVKVSTAKEPTATYICGDKYIEFHHCPLCGCTTHYTSTDKCEEKRTAINCRMFSLELMQSIPVRKFDGADSWQYIDK